jgi:hypothetical protein
MELHAGTIQSIHLVRVHSDHCVRSSAEASCILEITTSLLQVKLSLLQVNILRSEDKLIQATAPENDGLPILLLPDADTAHRLLSVEAGVVYFELLPLSLIKEFC